jgi:hypothetical protein
VNVAVITAYLGIKDFRINGVQYTVVIFQIQEGLIAVMIFGSVQPQVIGLLFVLVGFRIHQTCKFIS